MSSPQRLEVEDLHKHFPLRRGCSRRARERVKAVDGVRFDVRRGETLGLVGESGCGKTTVGRCVLRLIEPTAGTILLRRRRTSRISRRRQMRPLRRRMQIVFQDPYASLNPRLTAGTIVGEPLANLRHRCRATREAARRELFEHVGLRAGRA